MQATSNILLQPDDERYIDQQIDHLSHYFPAEDELPFMDIVVSGTQERPCISATIFLDDATLTSQQEGLTTQAAVQAAFLDLDHQINKWRMAQLQRQTMRQHIRSRRTITF